MKILKAKIQTELIIKNSHFINELFICDSQSNAKDLIKSQKEKYFDASHVCHAFVIGNNAEILGMSDAGEPSGTAGRPMLDVLRGSQVTNILLTVTRYFGGTLLGTGGLVKAYGDSAKSVIQKAIDDNLIEELVEKKEFSFEVDYSLYETIKRQIKDFTFYDLKESYESTVILQGKILSSQFNNFSDTIKNITAGKVLL